MIQKRITFIEEMGEWEGTLIPVAAKENPYESPKSNDIVAISFFLSICFTDYGFGAEIFTTVFFNLIFKVLHFLKNSFPKMLCFAHYFIFFTKFIIIFKFCSSSRFCPKTISFKYL